MRSVRPSKSLLALIAVAVAAACGQPGATDGGTGGSPVTAGGQGSIAGGGAAPGVAGGLAQSGSVGLGGMTNGGVMSGGAGASSAGTTSGAGGTPAGGVSGAGNGGSAGSGGAGGASAKAGCNGKPLCWDFEEGKIPQGFVPWRSTPADTGTLLVDNTKPFGGSGFSLHAKDLVGGPQHTLKYVLPQGFGPVMWGRMRLYTTPTRPDAHAGFFNARYPLPGQPDTAPENQLDWYEIASYQQAYMSIFHPPWPPGFPEDVQVSDTKLVLDRWTCVEWLFDGKNDADATQAALPRMWLDGTELLWPQHFTYSEPAGAAAPNRPKVGNFTLIELGVVTWQAVPTPTSWWLDDVALGKERIGCQ